MFFEGYIGAPPTVTVCSFICLVCAKLGVAAAAAKASAATAAAVGRVMVEFHVVLRMG